MRLIKNNIYRWAFIAGVASTIFFSDRLTKHLAMSHLEHERSVPLLPPVLYLTRVENKGAAFSLLIDQTTFLALLACGTVLGIIFFVWKRKVRDMMLIASLSLIIGGALGNLVDRVMLGYVIDFIDLRVWPVFNIADSAITIGAVILGWKIIFEK